MIPPPKKLSYGSKKDLKFRGASLLKSVTVEYSEDAGCASNHINFKSKGMPLLQSNKLTKAGKLNIPLMLRSLLVLC